MRTLKKNFWKPLLFSCAGLIVATIVFAGVNLIEPPDRPGIPEATDWDVDRVSLTYKAPGRDGGARISHYVIESHERGWMFWQKKGVALGLNCTVDGLVENTEYAFRAAAVNIAGQGEFSEASNYYITRKR